LSPAGDNNKIVMNTNENKPVVIRNKSITRKRLIDAVGTLLAKKGFKALGINALARQAGVDKVLIYRYFGGLPGLIAAYGKEGNFWPTARELAGGDPMAFTRLPLQEKLSMAARNFIKALKSRPVTLEIMIWEMSERNELTVQLEDVREKSIREFFNMFMPANMAGQELQAIAALFGSAISYLVLRSRNIDIYAGIELGKESGWERLENAMDMIIRSVISMDR